ncbi:hypothetical protein GCM10011369_04510 [Neiella marina]|uniref:Uncharacterized protein n=1 Tax=Neiella marina TaxID=508461 RepID=A0A8J2XMQ2_9GAMM|nr:hypothetical protein [Neiella marina]GGA66092.1 hypothetical protein GCM10011369_04510 [Neiella marina]
MKRAVFLVLPIVLAVGFAVSYLMTGDDLPAAGSESNATAAQTSTKSPDGNFKPLAPLAPAETVKPIQLIDPQDTAVLEVSEQNLDTDTQPWQAHDNYDIAIPDEIAAAPSFQLVTITPAMESEISIGDVIELPLSEAGEVITVEVTAETLHENGDYSWQGKTIDGNQSYPVIVTQGPNGTFGSIATADGTYTLTTVDGKGVVYKNPPLPDTHDDDFLIPPISDGDDHADHGHNH